MRTGTEKCADAPLPPYPLAPRTHIVMPNSHRTSDPLPPKNTWDCVKEAKDVPRCDSRTQRAHGRAVSPRREASRPCRSRPRLPGACRSVVGRGGRSSQTASASIQAGGRLAQVRREAVASAARAGGCSAWDVQVSGACKAAMRASGTSAPLYSRPRERPSDAAPCS